MALREFRDSRGTAWTAWDVPPRRVFDAARGADRRVRATPGFAPERRVNRERRRRVAHPELQSGWVCFTAGEEKRRLFPPPPAWDACTEAELRALCKGARAEPPRDGVPPPARE
jgi:hypothetical protein